MYQRAMMNGPTRNQGPMMNGPTRNQGLFQAHIG